MSSVYGSALAFRAALEERLKREALSRGVRLDRMRRRVMFERFLARIEAADPGSWILKGAVALEVRLGDHARATADVDLGLRASATDAAPELLTDRLQEIVATDVGDFFDYRLRDIRQMAIASTVDIGRARITVRLAGRDFGGFQVDIALRIHELGDTERLRLPAQLAFAGIEPPEVEVVALPRHIAEKFAGMLKMFPDRDNTRVRDLVDVVLMWEHGLVDTDRTAAALREVWRERGDTLPSAFPPLPVSWHARYEAIASEHGLDAATFPAALAVVTTLWREMFSTIDT